MQEKLVVEEILIINASPDAVWAVLKDFHGRWIDKVTVDEVDEQTRRMTSPDGKSVLEQLVSHSDAERAMTYRILEGALPVQNYESTLAVENAESEGATLVRWSAVFEAQGVPDEKAHEIITGLFRMGLASLNAKFQ